MCVNPQELRRIPLIPNRYLRSETDCYYVLDYLRRGVEGNPEFILTLKNTFNEKSIPCLERARRQVVEILLRYIPIVMQDAGLDNCILICTPRAKAQASYTPNQLLLQAAVSQAAQELPGVEDGSGAIVRHTNTKTTHFGDEVERVTADSSREPNTGERPYPGITNDTCFIDQGAVCGRDVILVDDVYTAGVNVDEDCIQALYDAGARQVILFAVSRTKMRGER